MTQYLNDPESFPRELTSLAAEAFVRGDREKKFYTFTHADTKTIPRGKAVRVSFEYGDEGALCEGGENDALQQEP